MCAHSSNLLKFVISDTKDKDQRVIIDRFRSKNQNFSVSPSFKTTLTTKKKKTNKAVVTAFLTELVHLVNEIFICKAENEH